MALSMAPSLPTEIRDEWLPVAEAAEIAGVPRRTAFRWVKQGLVKVKGTSGRRLVTPGSLKLLGAAPGSAMRALHGTTGALPPAYKVLGLEFDPDETVEGLLSWQETVEERLEVMAKRVESLEKRLGALSPKK